MIAFGLCYHIFAIVWLYVVRREHYCIWPGLTHLCYHMAVRRMARVLLPLPGLIHLCHHMAARRMAQVLLPLAWATSSFPSYGCTSSGASIIAFGLG